MNCKKYLVLMSACIDGELTADEKSMLDSHLETCGACRLKYKRMKITDRLFAATGAEGAPAYFETRFFERLKTRESRGESIFDFVFMEKRLIAAFLALILIGSVAGIKAYLTDSTHGYYGMQSYVTGTDTAAKDGGLLDAQSIALDDMMSEIVEETI